MLFIRVIKLAFLIIINTPREIYRWFKDRELRVIQNILDKEACEEQRYEEKWNG